MKHRITIGWVLFAASMFFYNQGNARLIQQGQTLPGRYYGQRPPAPHEQGSTRLALKRTANEADTLYAITLKNGVTVKGRIIHKSRKQIVLLTVDGLEVKVPVGSITSIRRIRGHLDAGRLQRFDPNDSRLLFAPSGRPLRRGDGYFSDFYVLFPSVAYGLTSNLSVAAGFSIVPGIGLGSQLKYVAPQLGFQASDNFAMSIGALYTSFRDDFAVGIAFVATSLGPPERSITAGAGLGYTREKGEDFQFAERPIFMVGSNFRLSNNLAFVTENWLITGVYNFGRR